MKKAFVILIALLSFVFAHAQVAVATDQYNLWYSANQRVHQGDSAMVWALCNVSSNATGSIKWGLPAGVTAIPATSYAGGSPQSYIWLSNLSPGIYAFTITGSSTSGATSTVHDTLTVLPALAQRTLIGFAATVNGSLVPIPITGGATLTYSDGTIIKQ